MFLIILSHFSLYGNWTNKNSLDAMSTVKVLLFDPFGPAAAICFFLITGYFSNVKKMDLERQIKKSKRKIIIIWRQTFFYSVLGGSVFYIFTNGASGVVELLKSFLPVILNEYWFVTCYILLMLFGPYIDVLISSVTEKQFDHIVVILFLLQIPALVGNELINRALIAFLGYLIGKFLAMNKGSLKKINNKYLFLFLIFIYFLDLLTIYALRYIGIPFEHAGHFTQYILAFLLSVPFFIIFIKLRSFSIKTVNYISSSVFSVYLITEQSQVRSFIWSDLFNVSKFQESPFLPLWGISVVFLIFLCCILFDIFIRVVYKKFVRVFLYFYYK
jgi:surface polysaccharide O-acyltransferase-like enzyme